MNMTIRKVVKGVKGLNINNHMKENFKKVWFKPFTPFTPSKSNHFNPFLTQKKIEIVIKINKHKMNTDNIRFHDLAKAFGDAEDPYLHIEKVTVKSGNDDTYTSKCEIKQNKQTTMDISLTTTTEKGTFNPRPRELDITVEFKGEHDEKRTLNIFFYKGKMYFDWIRN